MLQTHCLLRLGENCCRGLSVFVLMEVVTFKFTEFSLQKTLFFMLSVSLWEIKHRIIQFTWLPVYVFLITLLFSIVHAHFLHFFLKHWSYDFVTFYLCGWNDTPLQLIAFRDDQWPDFFVFGINPSMSDLVWYQKQRNLATGHHEMLLIVKVCHFIHKDKM
jgi:hypothetical protein